MKGFLLPFGEKVRMRGGTLSLSLSLKGEGIVVSRPLVLCDGLDALFPRSPQQTMEARSLASQGTNWIASLAALFKKEVLGHEAQPSLG